MSVLVEIKIQMCTELSFPWSFDSVISGLVFDFLTSLKCSYIGFSQTLFVNISSFRKRDHAFTNLTVKRGTNFKQDATEVTLLPH